MAAMIGYVGMACAAATFVATMCVYFTTHRVSKAERPTIVLTVEHTTAYLWVSNCALSTER